MAVERCSKERVAVASSERPRARAKRAKEYHSTDAMTPVRGVRSKQADVQEFRAVIMLVNLASMIRISREPCARMPHTLGSNL